MYDIIIIWWWASWLFCSINAPKDSKKLIIEKQKTLWNKILLSGWWRCNFTNLNIDPDRYFWQNKKMLASVFHKYSNYDFMNYLDENWIEYNVEDNGRVILKSWKAKELLDFLIEKSKENNTDIQTWQTITKIEKKDEFFKITTEQTDFLCKKLVISTWWISYPQIWATSFWVDIARQFWLKIIPSLPALCWLETKDDFSSLSWSSISWIVELFDWNKKIYENQWNILFTHRWLSGPVIFNCSAWLAEYLTKSYLSPFLKGEARRAEGFLKSSTPAKAGHSTSWSPSFPAGARHGKKEDINLKITPNKITKKLETFIKNIPSFFDWKESSTCREKKGQGDDFTTQIINFRPLEEAKVSSGGVDMNEIKPNFECKNISNLYFIWETLDIIWETWWFNLQRARSSGAICWQWL